MSDEALIAQTKVDEAARRTEHEANPIYSKATNENELLTKLKAELDAATAADPVDEEAVKKANYAYNE